MQRKILATLIVLSVLLSGLWAYDNTTHLGVSSGRSRSIGVKSFSSALMFSGGVS